MKTLRLFMVLLLITLGFSTTAQTPFSHFKSGLTIVPFSDRDVPLRDILHLDDVIIVGSLCVGFDCVDGESFGFDTVRLKENNLRMHFDDTSSSASFPANDWRFTFNDSANGGDNYFGIDDATAGTNPFRIEAGAPSNSLFVENTGDVGIKTNNPVVNLHMVDGNTPTVRLEQDGSSGFTAQTWDVAGNEANFFIRDVTNGSTLPFRIRPGAPSSSIDIAGGGSVGIGTGSPNGNASMDMGSSTKGLLINRMDNGERTTLGGLLAAGDVGMMVYDTDDLDMYLWDGAAWVAAGSDDQIADVFQLNVNDLELSLENDGAPTQTVDLSGYLDNTDDQVADVFQLNGNNLELSLEDDGAATQTVDLSGYLDNTDDQVADVFQLNGNNLELSLEDDGAATQTVDLSGYLDNTDNQDISGSALVGTDLTIGITGGASEVVDLSSLDDSGTDDQQLILNGNSLDLENGGSVDLSGYLDNTDEQFLGYALNGNTLTLLITNGNNVMIDLTSVIQPLIDENAAQQAQIDDILIRLQLLEDCACMLSVPDHNIDPNRPELYQNVPNPFDNTTSIGYFIPFGYSSANLVVSSTTGQILNNIKITEFGEGSIQFDRSTLASAMYFYTLYVDGQRIDTKRMLIE